ncbi:helix-turn-helix domain-containing protein [Diaphorobacter ruginosibacter]|nr:helix-turn-helix transcriptional regulator [Diaphorobacter ruginosibacter]
MSSAVFMNQIIGIPNIKVNRNSDFFLMDHVAMTSIPIFQTFGERLSWWIKHRDLTQKELAVLVGVGQPALNELIKGRSAEPRAGAFVKMCKVLGLRPEYLIWGEGPAEATNFAQLTGLEAQLVMLFRGLPDDAKRDALLIDVNHAYNRTSSGKPTAADPFGGATPPSPPKAVKSTTKAPKPPSAKKPRQHA